MKPKLIFLTTDLPTDLRSGYKIRIYNLMKKLSEKYELIVVHVGDGKINPDDSLVKVNQYNFVKARAKSIKTLLKSYLAATPFLAYRFTPDLLQTVIDDILSSDDIKAAYLNLTVYNINLPNDFDLFIDQHDIISQTMTEGASGASSQMRRIIYNIEAARWPKFEKLYYKRFDSKRLKVISVKDEDCIETKQWVSEGTVFTIANGHSVDASLDGHCEWKPSLLFVGTSHERNINALKAFYFDVLPKIQEKFPTIKTKIVGAFEASDLSFIVAKGKNISIHTYVDDISDYYENGNVQVLPFNMGAGSKLKVFESFAYGVPVVGTPLAFTGVSLGVMDKLVCSDNCNTLAKLVIDLIEDQALYTKVAQEMKLISQDYHWDRILQNVNFSNEK